MSELLHLDLQGKTLEEIIMHPTLWAKRIEVAAQEGLDALSDLQIQLSKIEGPVARARECQTFFALNEPKKAAKVIEGETHSLCRAMHLAVKLSEGSFSSYLWVTEQPEILTRNHNDPLEREAQMRWDFMRAQAFQQIENYIDAIRFYTLSQRSADLFGVNSIAQVSETKMQSLNQLPLKHRIETFLIQLQEMKKNEDFRVKEYILKNLCILYFLDNDIDSLRKYASELHPDILLDHTILLTDFFLTLPPSAQIHKLDEHKNQPFCVSGFLLSVARESKWHANLLRNNQNIAAKLKPVLDTEIPDNLDVPILNFIMLSVKIMFHVMAEDFKKSEKYWGQMQYMVSLSDVTGDLPDWGKYYMAFTEAFLAYSKGQEIHSNLRESIIEGLGKMESFSNFVVQLCPEMVYVLNEQERDDVLENTLNEVLVITKEGCFLGKEEVDGFPEHSALVGEIDRWYRGVAKRDPELTESYAKRVSGIGCKGVVVAWKVEEKMRELK